MTILFKVYVLCDPRDGYPRYVGVTRNSLEKRLAEHICDKNTTKKTSWIKKLRKYGLKPVVRLWLENISEHEIDEKEVECIMFARQIFGNSILNISPGGSAAFRDLKHTKEVKRKISESLCEWHKTHVHHNIGKQQSQESNDLRRQTMLEWHKNNEHPQRGKPSHFKGKIRPEIVGENNPMFGKERQDLIENNKRLKSKAVCQYDKDGIFMAEYYSAHEATRQSGAHNISKAIKYGTTSKGFYWKFKQ